MTICPICNKRRKRIAYRVMTLGIDSPYRKEGVPVCDVCIASANAETWDKIREELDKK